MKIEISRLRKWDDEQITTSPHAFTCSLTGKSSLKFEYDFSVSLDQIEDLEINLTDIIKQLQDYRIKQGEK
jgi:hypothetical protein